jgi:hypothetical protein
MNASDAPRKTLEYRVGTNATSARLFGRLRVRFAETDRRMKWKRKFLAF